MQQTIYNNVLMAGWVILFTLGITLLLGTCPNKKVFKAYNRSRKILGLAFFALGTEVLSIWILNPRSVMPHIATMINLSLSYLVAILLGMALISLLDHQYLCKRQIVRDFGQWGIFVVAMWILTLFVRVINPKIILIVAAIFFFYAILCICIRFVFTYIWAKNSLDNYYGDDIEIFARWLYKSSLGIMILGALGSFFCFAPPIVNAGYMVVTLFFFVYVYISMHNYMVNYESIETAVVAEETTKTYSDFIFVNAIPIKSDKDDENKQMPPEDKNILKDGIERWISQNGYLAQGITIEKLALQVCTNRLYLSNFINAEYNCNFRGLINSLRIDYAERLLTEEPHKPIGEIAIEAGFSSATYFAKLFLKYKGILPMQYRKLHYMAEKSNE